MICSSLEEVNISSFNITKVKNAKNIFSGCPETLKIKIRDQNKNFKVYELK